MFTSITCGAIRQEQGRSNSLWAPPFSFHSMSCSVGGARSKATTRSEKSEICSLISASLSCLSWSTISLRFLFPLFFSRSAEEKKTNQLIWWLDQVAVGCQEGLGHAYALWAQVPERSRFPRWWAGCSCPATGSPPAFAEHLETNGLNSYPVKQRTGGGALWEMIKDHPVSSWARGWWAFPSASLLWWSRTVRHHWGSSESLKVKEGIFDFKIRH